MVLASGCFSKPGFRGGDDAGPTDGGSDGPLPTSYGPWSTNAISIPVGGVSDDIMPTVSMNPNELFFVSTRTGDYHLFVSKRLDSSSAWQPASRVTTAVERETDPTISPDGLDLYWFAGGAIVHAHRTSWSEDFVTTTTNTLPSVGPFDFTGDGGRIIAGSTANPVAPSSDIIELVASGANWNAGPALGLPDTTVADTAPTVRHDGLEVYYEHDAAGNYETMVATRTSVDTGFDLASTFRVGGVKVGDPELSYDGTEMYFNMGSPYRLYVLRRSVEDP